MTILLGNGDGTFAATPNLSTGSTPQSVATGDFNQDGIADLAVVNANSVLIFLGRGDGTFTAASPSAPTGMSPITVAVLFSRESYQGSAESSPVSRSSMSSSSASSTSPEALR